MTTPDFIEQRGSAPRFIVDINVGHLVRKLRMLGYDTLFINPIDDSSLVEIALDQGRILISGDRGIFERRLLKTGKVRGLWVDTYETHPWQLRQVMRAFRLGNHLSLTRCIECNTALTVKSKEEAEGHVPPFVFETVRRYSYCPDCRKFFWEGDHVKRMREAIERL